jgi:hypothetical protein
VEVDALVLDAAATSPLIKEEDVAATSPLIKEERTQFSKGH